MPAILTESRAETAKVLLERLLDESQEGSSIFRGQGFVGWDLVPSAWRPNSLQALRSRIDEKLGSMWSLELPGDTQLDHATLTEKYIGNSGPDSMIRLRDLVVGLTAERQIVREFCEGCDRVALAVPGFDDNRSLSPIVDVSVLSGADISAAGSKALTPAFPTTVTYAFAQHMGLPTRLLDFSDSPFKAAYFAATSAYQKPPVKLRGHDFVVWVAKPPRLDSDLALAAALMGSDVRQFRVLRSQISYLHAQDGLFIDCNASSNRFYLDNGRWPSMADVMHGWTLEKIRVPTEQAAETLQRLERMGVSNITMRPSYEGVASAIVRQHLPKPQGSGFSMMMFVGDEVVSPAVQDTSRGT